MTRARLGCPAGVVLDLDGTLYDEQGVVAGAREAVGALRDAGIRVCFATNTTRRPHRAVVEHLTSLGIAVADHEVVTAPRAAVAWLQMQQISTVALHVAPSTEAEFEAIPRDEHQPSAVVVGDLGENWTVDRLNRVFRHVMRGARLVALQKNRYWQTESGLTLDAGPFVAAIEYASGVEAEVVGKPSRAFFLAACRVLGRAPQDVVMVGDDIETDVGGAIAAGLRGALVRTGKFREEDLERGITPDTVLASVAEVPAWVATLSVPSEPPAQEGPLPG